MPNPEAIRLAYQEHLSEYWLHLSKVSAWVALILVPAGSALDYLVYPDQFTLFLGLRLLCSVAIALSSIGYLPSRKPKNVRHFTFAWLFCVQAMICYMIFLTEGSHSRYYAGLNLSILAVGIVLPTSLKEAVFFCVATIGLYTLTCASVQAGHQDANVFYSNLFFLVTTALITMISAYFNEKRRFDEFRLRYELDSRNKQLATLDKQKTEFFANVSHELRTPLTLILAPVQELLERSSPVPDALGSRLIVIRDNALRLLKLVNDLLDVIRMEEGKDVLASVPVDVNSVLRGTFDGMLHLADTKEIKMEKRLAPGSLVMIGDERALEKIFVNLINNAIKFTDKHGSVTVRSRQQVGSIAIEVVDSGIGIPREQQAFIFDRFRQVDGSTTRRFRGTGLGLALVKEMAERMGGSVNVDSEPGAGTTMEVRFPVASAQETAEAQLASLEEGDRLQQLHRLADRKGGLSVEDSTLRWEQQIPEAEDDRARVLVIEDEPDMRRYLTEILQRTYRVVQARTGSEGLKLALERKPDLILLDLMLPEIDGIEVCRRIREEDPNHTQKIMLLTARVDEQAKLSALDNGADDFLTKPFSSVEVKTRLRTLLAAATLERDLAERNQRLQKALVELEETQAQLIHSEKLNALGSLSAGLLHEINNPLNYSLTALQMIRSDPSIAGDELLADMVADIDEGMQRIRTIVSDLRAFAYPSEAEKQVPFPFEEAVQSALRFTANELKDVRVVQDVCGSRVLGSKSHITQVLVNLLSNAAKAVSLAPKPAGGEIRITAAAREGRLRVHVEDNGVGMDSGTLNRIFEPFFTTQDVGEGMGLGLSISHTIIANHGGQLFAESQPGVGTVMSFDLALAGDEAD